jgi:hypothetical protein
VTPVEWAGVAAAATSVISAYFMGLRWLVKHWLNELRPNGGASMKDQLNRLEKRVDELFTVIASK